jgi:hypothetical protein
MENSFDIIFILVIIGLGLFLNRFFKLKYPRIQLGVLDALLFFHFFMGVVYFVYAQYNNSDSHHYYAKVVREFRGDEWINYLATGTSFIEFLAWPFVHGLQMGYAGLMALFAFFGYIGYLFFFLLFKENLRYTHLWFGTALLTLIFFLPNTHFWSVSLGKGAVIFMGIGAFFFAMSRPGDRWPLAIPALLLIYMVRPHIAFVFLAATSLAILMGNRDLKLQHKISLFLLAGVTLAFVYQSVFSYVGIEGDDIFEEGFNVTNRLAGKLSSRADSGFDIQNFSLPQKIFAFLFFPLFFNASSMLSFIVSFENLFYLLIGAQLLRLKFLKYLVQSEFITKLCFLSFVGASAALAQIAGNMGIAIRMKSMVMLLFLFVVLQFMDHKQWQLRLTKWKRLQRAAKFASVSEIPTKAEHV